MLNKIRTALRISTTLYDSELLELQEAAIADLALVGIPMAVKTVTGTTTVTDGAVEVDASAFMLVHQECGSYTITYRNNSWSEDLSALGITLTGTPVNGRIITVTVSRDVSDPLYTRAVITYVRVRFGSPDDYDRLKTAYDEQKAQLISATGYGIQGVSE